ncbi:MAG: transcription elongation factor GreA [Patescibacteria group bacterium]
MNTEYLTQSKFDEFTKELEVLKSEKRTEIAKQLEYAKSLGDLSENAEYHEARNAQAVVEDRINHLENLLKSASIVSSHDTGTVNVGTTVTLKRENDSSKKTFIIVGSEEADAANGKISVRSPLGSSAMGKKKGESFSFNSPSGAMTYKVVDIE